MRKNWEKLAILSAALTLGSYYCASSYAYMGGGLQLWYALMGAAWGIGGLFLGVYAITVYFNNDKV